MPATIVSNAAFANGQLVDLANTLNVQENGLVQVQLSYACLGTASAIERNMALFVKDSPPPLPLPEAVRNTPLVNKNVFLVNHTQRTERGIYYIDAQYVGVSALDKVKVSQDTEERSHSGYFIYSFTTGVTTVKAVGTITFDYTSPTTTVEHCSYDLKSRKGGKLLGDDPPKQRNVQILPADRIGQGGSFPFPNDVVSTSIEKVGPVFVIRETTRVEYKNPEF